MLAHRRPVWPLLLAVCLAAGCGGGRPSQPSTEPAPLPQTGQSVGVLVFEDDNRDGQLQREEGSRIPQVRVRIGAASVVTGPGGRAVVTGVPSGAQTVSLDPASLPPFFLPGPPVLLQVPPIEDVPLPASLPIGDNSPRTYLALGDSITLGSGPIRRSAYPPRLESRLTGFFGGATVVNRARDGATSDAGLRFVDEQLARVRPAYALLMFGTNDWHDPRCQDSPPCRVVDNLREMVRRVRGRGSLPVVATVPLVNPLRNDGRNAWNRAVNTEISTMAAQEGALLADVYGVMSRQPDPHALFDDEVHPNDHGSDVISFAFFDAITRRR